MTLEDIKADYEEKNQELKKVKDKITMRERQIYRLEKKKERANEKSHWTHQVNDIMKIVAEKTPHVTWDDGSRFVSGMRCQYWRFGKTKEDITVGICFTPGVDSNINFDTGEEISGFNKNSIGAMNGFHRKSKQLENIQELLDVVKSSEQEEKKRREEKQEKIKLEIDRGESVVIGNRERGILHKYLEPGFCEIFFGDRENEKRRVNDIRKLTLWEERNPGEIQDW
jgi:hypothetical protein